jgi:hypothetical protein
LADVLATYLKRTTVAAGKSKAINLRVTVPATLSLGSHFPCASVALRGESVTAAGGCEFVVE